MTHIFISHMQEDAACVEQIRQGLESQGYRVWRNTRNIDPGSSLYPWTIENGIVGSATVVLVWSANAALSEWVERHTLFAQRLKKPLLPVVIDGTDLPNTLVNLSPITSQPPCADALASLVQHLPPADSQDSLLALCEQAADERISLRKAAIQQAAEMLQRGEHREELLALLEYIARRDLISNVQEKAQAVLDAETRKATSPQHKDQSRHIFGVKCRNGHITYFDKRRVCLAQAKVVRRIKQRAGTELDELDLKCGKCDVEMTVHVDCGGYR